jgi:hypothetical protein
VTTDLPFAPLLYVKRSDVCDGAALTIGMQTLHLTRIQTNELIALLTSVTNNPKSGISAAQLDVADHYSLRDKSDA